MMGGGQASGQNVLYFMVVLSVQPCLRTVLLVYGDHARMKMVCMQLV